MKAITIAAAPSPGPGPDKGPDKGPVAHDEARAVPPPEAPAAARAAPRPPAQPRMLSLRVKGVIAFLVLVGYAMLIGIFTDVERGKLLAMVDGLERTHRAEEQLSQVNMSMARTLLAVNEAFSAGERSLPSLATAMEIEATLALMEPIERAHPHLLMRSRKLQALVNDLVRTPSRGVLAVTRSTLNELFVELDSITGATREQKRQLLTRYYQVYDRITLQGLAMGVVGFIVLGAVTVIFFSRLTWDIRKLETHALGIVSGNRGEPLRVTRSDELGSLMSAVNQMQHDLRQRERQIERARHEQFHREKMAAVGSLAAQLAHEINNPIAAISGIASSMNEIRHSHQCPNQGVVCQPELILQQAKRISLITRQIAEFSRPQTMQAELLDLNQLVRNTCNFVSYDRRFRSVDLETSLDSDLPAVRGVADHLTQVLMNVLINAADALEAMPADYRRHIRVTTRASAEEVIVEVVDNGKGMDADTLGRAFDEYFSTKPAGRGSGLGLSLCRDLVREAGGSIELDSTPGAGTSARLALPLKARTLA
jgi:signal transduction histidine kinase